MVIYILSGGSIDLKTLKTYRKLHPEDYLIAADRGLEAAHYLGILPDLAVGDFDSIDEGLFLKYRDKIEFAIYQPEKDETDTELALRLALEKKPHEIVIFGATGTRLDHVLSNIHILMASLNKGVPCFMVDRYNRLRLIKQGLTIKKSEQYGNYISLIPFTETVKELTLEGFRYPLQSAQLSLGHSLGISNELIEENGRIYFSEGILILAETKD